MPTSPRHLAGAISLTLLVALAGCGDDVDEGEDAAAPAALRSCSPVGTELEEEATMTVDVELDEYAFRPSSMAADAGVVTFTAANVGEEEHELAFLPGGGDVPLDDRGLPDEDALAEAGAFELEAFGPVQTCNATYDLEPGEYTVFCIVRADDGETHAAKGMETTMTVS